MPFDISEQISCVEREIAMRQYVYKRNVELGKMSQHKADNEVALMQAVLQTLLAIKDSQNPTAPPTQMRLD